jgi:cytochrome c oxidase subunit 3
MSTLAPNLAIKVPGSRDAGGGSPPSYGGGGDGNDGASNGAFNYGERLRRARLGLVLGLTAVFMLFVGFTSALLVRKGLPSFDAETNTYSRDWITLRLPWTLLMVNTFVLLLSSVTIEFARRAIARRAALAPVKSIPGVSLGDERELPWLGMTVILGLGFLAGQLVLWDILRAHSFFVNTSPSSSFTYLLFATHAIHLAGGIIALVYASASVWLMHKPVEAQRIVVDVTAWYWHFMALLWIYILVLLMIVR